MITASTRDCLQVAQKLTRKRKNLRKTQKNFKHNRIIPQKENVLHRAGRLETFSPPVLNKAFSKKGMQKILGGFSNENVYFGIVRR